MILFLLTTIFSCFIYSNNAYSITIDVQNKVVNTPNAYTFTFSFLDSTVRNITMYFPSDSDLSSGLLAIYLNSNPTSIVSSSYTVDNILKKITVRDQIPTANILKFKIMNVKNPPSASQYLFSADIIPAPSDALTGGSTLVTYQQGTLVSCNWKFDGFTGSTNSFVNIYIVLGNKLIKGVNQLSVLFPGFYQDSDTKYLTLNALNPTITYSIDNGTTFGSPMSSNPIVVANNKIQFYINLTNDLTSGSNFRIKFSGIVNPPTQSPSGTGFSVSTLDSAGWGIDSSSSCSIDPLNILQLTGVFDQTTLKVNDNYPTPIITVGAPIPFIVYATDQMQLEFNSALSVTNSSPLQISFYRGKAYVIFSVDNSIANSSTFRYFKGNLKDDRQTVVNSQFKFSFTIKAPYSQKPWDFTIWLKRASGFYVKIKASLSALAIPLSNSKVSLVPYSSEMAVESNYTLNIQLQRAISKNGKILLGFNLDYQIKAGPCIGYQGSNRITSSPDCQFLLKDGFNWLVFKIGQSTTGSIFDVATQLRIQYSSTLIKNPIYFGTYYFRLEVYYTEFDDSLVEYAVNFGNVITSTHTSKAASLGSNDFMVYDNPTVNILYMNQVYILDGSTVEFSFPYEVYSFDFLGKITINGVQTSSLTFVKNIPGKKLQININQNVAAGSNWVFPIVILVPSIEGNYPTIRIKTFKGANVYQQVLSGLQIRVKTPSPKLTAIIQPKLSTMVDANTTYEVRIQSQVPLPGNFLLYLTIPTQIGITNNLTCSHAIGTCTPITRPDTKVLHLPISSSYTTADTFQQFIFTVSEFINPRSIAPTSTWLAEIKANYNGTLGAVSYASTTSDNFIMNPGVVCSLDSTKNYYRGNTDNVLIGCLFTNDVLQNDQIYLTSTSDSYSLNPTGTFNCSSLSPITPNIFLSSSNMLVIKFTVTGNFTGNKKALNLQIGGLISNLMTFYSSQPASIQITRQDANNKSIDKGSFFYDISCNQNATITLKNCKNCFGNVCTACYSGMYMLNNDSCVSSCPSQTQYRALNNVNTSQCQFCTSPCYTCESATRCNSCINSSYFLMTTDLSCVLQCNVTSSFWVNTVDNPTQKLCDTCLSSCVRCINDSITGCLECQSTFVLQNGQCKTDCKVARSYKLGGVCYTCDVACLSCSGAGSNNCILCVSGYYKDNGVCVLNCPFNKYTLADGTCGCQGLCSTCNNASPVYCTSCLNSSQFIFNGACLSSCPQYTFQLASKCISCPTNCLKCTSQNSCLQCGPGLFIYESNCYSDCNSISYQYDTNGSNCILCPTGCDTCNGTICLSCLENYEKDGTSCTKACLKTNTCTVQSKVPDSILTIPGSIAFFIWAAIVIGAKFFVPKLYAPYSIIFVTAGIELFLIISTTIYSKELMGQIVQRLLVTDYSYRQTIFGLLIVALALNYVTNIVFAILFYKYIIPLIKNPRQVDYITIGAAFVVGMITNYRFCLIIFSKMFPKPQVQIDFSSRLTPVHYLCISSVVLSFLSIGASVIIIKNQYPLTDIFMLGVDILIIQLVLIGFTIWMVSCDKPESYFENQTKKYTIEQIYRTEEGMIVQQNQKNMSKFNLNIKDQFEQKSEEGPQKLQDYDKRLLDKMSTVNMTKALIPQSDNEKPLAKISRHNNIDLQKTRLRNSNNKVENTFDNSDISGLSFSESKNNMGKSKKIIQTENTRLKGKSKQNVIDFDKINENQPIQESAKKFQTSDEDNLPRTLQKKQNNNILAEINQPSSDQIPNLPLNDSVFHQKASSQFGHKVKPRKILSQTTQKSQMLKNKSPLKKSSIIETQNMNKSQLKHNMRKKNKFFQSQFEEGSQEPVKDDGFDIKKIDLQSIIKSKIVVVENKDKLNLSGKRDSVQNENNISSIEKKQEQNSDFNEQISPSWFNVQNQRFDFSSIDSDFPQNG